MQCLRNFHRNQPASIIYVTIIGASLEEVRTISVVSAPHNSII
ncbi:hypothetical protein OTSANNIE_1558 [Anaplasma phagocytophilum str. Annie]|nr:hypothetical protein APHHGE2_0023 [Anaplasma phagocytophilum str. HGE2]KJV97904.1 hypothetical protein OTSANNIE_1558 [Anaplasma phagocytophilum str. Annie]